MVHVLNLENIIIIFTLELDYIDYITYDFINIY